MTDRETLVAAAYETISQGSQSFAAASKLFAPATRERAWLLYAWCRAADDLTDGQDLGHGSDIVIDPAKTQMKLESLTDIALAGDAPVPTPFAALRQVTRETGMPRRFIDDHLAGFALDAAAWKPQSEDDLLRYCYHVAGTVGCMMAIVMGVSREDHETLDRACDLGLAFQLANIARDIVPDAAAGRCYLPTMWLEELGLAQADLTKPGHREALSKLAKRLVMMARAYRESARIGAARLPFRSRLAVLSADGIYGAIGEKVFAEGDHAWDTRVRISTTGKLGLVGIAALRSMQRPKDLPRQALWTRPYQAEGARVRSSASAELRSSALS